MENKRYNLIVKDYIDTILNIDPDISRQMKSHYKKQFIEITEGETSENLLFKLCKKISDLEDEVKATRQNYNELKDDVKQYRTTIKSYQQKEEHLIQEYGENSYQHKIYQKGELFKILHK
jgi:predicted RNase H-like nuclease (RuvC/YqgF family)